MGVAQALGAAVRVLPGLAGGGPLRGSGQPMAGAAYPPVAVARHRMGRELVHQDRPVRVSPPHLQRGRRQPLGLLPGVPGGHPGHPCPHRAELRRRRRPDRDGARPDLCHRRLAGRPRGIRFGHRRSNGPDLRLLPSGLRAQHGLFRRPVHHRRGRVPVRVCRGATGSPPRCSPCWPASPGTSACCSSSAWPRRPSPGLPGNTRGGPWSPC